MVVRAVWGIAAVPVGLLVALASRYGPHRDELYFIAAGHHPAFGYPDQPPLSPLIAGLADTVAPGSLTVLRLPSALAVGLVVVLAALCAKELGGGRRAQILTATATAGASLLFVVGHLLSTTTFDILAWTALLYLVLRATVRRQPKVWLAAGAVTGVALQNKSLILVLLAALAVGLLTDRDGRRQVREPWLWAGVVVALGLWGPNLAWQAAHGWPQLDLAQDISAEYGALGERVMFLVFAVVLVSPVGFLLWGRGLVTMLRARDDDPLRRARPLAVAFVVLFVLFVVAGGKGYYLGGFYPVLLAAGAVAVERSRGRYRDWMISLVVAAVPGVFIGLPILPAAAYAASPLAVMGGEQLETMNWVDLAAGVWDGVQVAPVDAVVFTGNYGEAGAALWYDVETPVYSGHNGFWSWGPPDDDDAPVVLVLVADASPADYPFPNCRVVTTVQPSVNADNEENGAVVRVCDAPAGGWAAAWPRLKRLAA